MKGYYLWSACTAFCGWLLMMLWNRGILFLRATAKVSVIRVFGGRFSVVSNFLHIWLLSHHTTKCSNYIQRTFCPHTSEIWWITSPFSMHAELNSLKKCFQMLSLKYPWVSFHLIKFFNHSKLSSISVSRFRACHCIQSIDCFIFTKGKLQNCAINNKSRENY